MKCRLVRGSYLFSLYSLAVNKTKASRSSGYASVKTSPLIFTISLVCEVWEPPVEMGMMPVNKPTVVICSGLNRLPHIFKVCYWQNL